MRVYIITILVTVLSISTSVSQTMNKRGIKKETTYYDADKTKKQSEGYVIDNEYYSFNGQKWGKWTYWYENGNLQEISHYYLGKLDGIVQQFYPSGKIKTEGIFLEGIQEGKMTAYYENGNIAELGMFHKDEKIGAFYYNYSDSTPMKKSFYDSSGNEFVVSYYSKNGKQTLTEGDGTMTIYFSTGDIKEKYEYKDSIKNGPFSVYKVNGKLLTKGEFANGLPHGEWIEKQPFVDRDKVLKTYDNGKLTGKYEKYFSNGKINIKGTFDDGTKVGLWQWFDLRGNKDMEGTFKDNLQHGKWTYYHPNGNVKSTGDFKKGVKVGKWQYFYENGTKWREGSYDESGKKTGEWSVWFEDEQLSHKGTYKDDIEHGEWESWYENGQEKDIGSYDMGKMTGDWKGYYPNGRQSYEGSYENDMKIGDWTYWHGNGIKRLEGNYKIITTKREMVSLSDLDVTKSVEHGKWTQYSDVDGSLVIEMNYKNGEQHGQWNYYYPGGEVKSSSMKYKDGLLDGTYKSYSRQGQLQSEIDYKDNVKHGNMIIYDDNGNVIKKQTYKFGYPVDKNAKGYRP